MIRDQGSTLSGGSAPPAQVTLPIPILTFSTFLLFYFSTFLLLDRGNLLRSPSPNYHIDPFCFFKSLISAQLTLILSHDFNLLQFIIPGHHNTNHNTTMPQYQYHNPTIPQCHNTTTTGHHNTNHYGNWTWDEAGKELEWFDWLQDEPNDYETQK